MRTTVIIHVHLTGTDNFNQPYSEIPWFHGGRPVSSDPGWPEPVLDCRPGLRISDER